MSDDRDGMTPEEALRIIGDWRLGKAIEHFDKLRPFASTDEDQAWLDRFQGWLLMVKDVIDQVPPAPHQGAMS